MQLRHIRPGSVDWEDALVEDDAGGYARLSPEEKLKLQAITAIERGDANQAMSARPRTG